MSEVNKIKEDFEFRNFSVYFKTSLGQLKIELNDDLKANQKINLLQANSQTHISTQESQFQYKQDQKQPQRDENTKNLSSCKRSKNKKRNDQNITRTIVRRLKGLNQQIYNINLPKFYDNPKIIFLLALFRKYNNDKKLQTLKSYLQEQFVKEMQAQSPTEKKEIKLIKSINFFMSLTSQDLKDTEIQNTKKRMEKQTQLKKQPIKFTLQELHSAQRQIIAYF